MFVGDLRYKWVGVKSLFRLSDSVNLEDFADDIALLSHNHQQMQEKTSLVAQNSEKLGLKIHNEKSKLLKVNSTSTHPISIETKALEEVDSFTYLGSIVDKQGGTEMQT